MPLPCISVKSSPDNDRVQRLVRQRSSLFIVSPHPDSLYGLDVFEYLIDEAMLYADSPGIGAREVTDKLFKPGRILVRVFKEDVQ
jgi:hypothetical protein